MISWARDARQEKERKKEEEEEDEIWIAELKASELRHHRCENKYRITTIACKFAIS